MLFRSVRNFTPSLCAQIGPNRRQTNYPYTFATYLRPHEPSTLLHCARGAESLSKSLQTSPIFLASESRPERLTPCATAYRVRTFLLPMPRTSEINSQPPEYPQVPTLGTMVLPVTPSSPTRLHTCPDDMDLIIDDQNSPTPIPMNMA